VTGYAHRTKVNGRLTAAMRRDLAATMDGTATEAQFQRVVIAYAKENGWLVYHTPPAAVRPGKHVTPTQGHVGFPDIVAIRDGRCLFVELKSSGGQTTAQEVWMHRLEECAGVEYFLWWPRHWPQAREILRATA
jgi:hypothetical protein